MYIIMVNNFIRFHFQHKSKSLKACLEEGASLVHEDVNVAWIPMTFFFSSSGTKRRRKRCGARIFPLPYYTTACVCVSEASLLLSPFKTSDVSVWFWKICKIQWSWAKLKHWFGIIEIRYKYYENRNCNCDAFSSWVNDYILVLFSKK